MTGDICRNLEVSCGVRVLAGFTDLLLTFRVIYSGIVQSDEVQIHTLPPNS